MNGRLITGRPVAPAAYALYFEATAAEARGDLRRARDFYLEAEDNDPESPELWTRIGSLSCQLKLAMADSEFMTALALDPRYAPAWLERARCELTRGRLERALRSARKAQVFSPEDFETTAMLVDVHVARRDINAAEAQLVGYALTYPDSAVAWEKLRDFAATQRRAQWVPFAENWPLGSRMLQRSNGPQTQLQSAIVDNDLALAQRLATENRLPQIAVVKVALSLGRFELAVRQAQVLIDAAPSDSSLRLWGLLAAHRAGNEQVFSQWLKLPTELSPLDDDAQTTLWLLLAERYGPLEGGPE